MKADEKECPFCAEIIKAKAKVCKHCGRDLENLNNFSSEKKSRKTRDVTRYCGYCGYKEIGARVDFAAKRTCPECDVNSVFVTESEHKILQAKRVASEELDKNLKEAAPLVNKSIDNLPILPKNDEGDVYLEAIEYGIIIPHNATYDQIVEMTRDAQRKRIDENPYVDMDRCAIAVECRRPPSSRQLDFLNTLHASCPQPLVYNTASRLITALYGNGYEGIPAPQLGCPFCGNEMYAERKQCYHCGSSLDNWVLEGTFDDGGRVRIESKTDKNRQLISAIAPVLPSLIIDTDKTPLTPQYFIYADSTKIQPRNQEKETEKNIPTGQTKTRNENEEQNSSIAEMIGGCAALVVMGYIAYRIIKWYFFSDASE